jgi:hypothetical protein
VFRVAPDTGAQIRHLKQFAKNSKSGQTEVRFNAQEIKVSHASMLKARRQHQKTRKLLDGAAKKEKRLAKLALAGPVVKKKKVKKERVKKEKVQKEGAQTEKVKKVKLTAEELGRQESKESKKSSAGAGKKGAS